MSFIQNDATSTVHAAGYFLEHEECVRETRQVAQTLATTADNGTKYVKMGTPYPSNDASCIGIVYEDVDVTTGSMPASIVTKGVVNTDKLPVELNENAVSALTALGFTFVTSASVTRPY